MTIPLIILAVLSVAGGWVQLPHIFGGHPYFNEFLSKSTGVAEHADPALATKEYWLLGATIVGLIIIYVACQRLFAVKEFNGEYKSGFKKLLANKWYVDELYDSIIVKPLNRLGDFFDKVFESQVVDWLVNGAGKAVNYGSRQLRLLQSGHVGSYILLMVISMLLIFAWQFFIRK
jgi:NADH-quinone oxidoreductase subunit L